MQRRGFNAVVYLDDYLVISHNYWDCMKGLNTLITLFRLLGFGIAWEKTAGPTRSLTFLGIKIDSESFTLSLPEDKVATLSTLLRKIRASCRQLQQLAGRLSWAAHVVNGGRVYQQRVLDLLRPLKKADHKIHLTDAFRDDITFWLELLQTLNSSEIRPPWRAPVIMNTDACDQGGGMITNDGWGL
ncbi:hypothetical protein LSH36_463g04022 [Paralvinella palmiformis]|uniref:Reverse transcriptase domain-containing protein n=1 Tax=Paralvinella palmiformis TaxID=53620 RepID=A0AAD9MYS6_9ANNE|nr:hypothetical protein LSH36_463g04022 [Paralvinella palmiformis]